MLSSRVCSTSASARFGRHLLIWFGVVAMAACSARRGGGSDDDGSDGTDGSVGFDPTGGDPGSDGVIGSDGSDGTDGTDGVDGTDGTDGTTSTDGNDGTGEGCQSDKDCQGVNDRCNAEGECVECLADPECPEAGQTCFQGFCTACAPGVRTCSGMDVVECVDGSPKVVETCPAGGLCNAGQCYKCYPGVKKCDELGRATECAQDGSGFVVKQDCAAESLECANGLCKGGCGNDSKAGTNAGCEFWAIDLDNAIDPEGGADAWNATFAVIVSNTSASNSAKVKLERPDGTTDERTLAPLSLEIFQLDKKWGIQGGGLTDSGFHITSNQPVTTYQFNPLENEQVFSNDASVLFPTSSFGTEYRIVSLPDIGTFHAFATILAPKADTTVTVTTTAAASAGAAGSLTAGSPKSFGLAAGQVLNIESTVQGSDLSGTLITSDKPILVFAGHEAAVTGDKCCADHLEQQMAPVPAWGKSYVIARSKRRFKEPEYVRVVAHQDGTQITVNPAVVSPPAFTLNAGQMKELVVDGDFQITANQPVMVAQFLASSFEVVGPGLDSCSSNAQCPLNWTCSGTCTSGACVNDAACGAGFTCETYTDPLFGGTTSECAPIGDPTLILAAPAEQWLTDYVFLTPPKYAENYITIVAEPDTVVTLDNATIPDGSFSTIAGTTYRVYRGSVTEGVHVLSATKAVSVIAYGYDDDVSYGYPAGLGIKTLP